MGAGDQDAPRQEVGELQRIPLDQIARNERNPRQTFDPRTIQRLASSLEEIGLQVPITVYRHPRKAHIPFVLLDGECRFRAAKEINWTTIPALIVPRPSSNENAVRMFNIHMLREDWKEIETAWALEQIIEETGTDVDRELQKLTGLSIDRIRNMRRVLAFPRAVQEKVARGELPYQLLVELDKNLLAKRRDELRADESPPVLEMGVAKLRDIFLKKYIDQVEKDVVDLRRVGTLFDTARGEGKVAQRAKSALSKLVTQPEATIEEAYEAGAASSVELTKIVRDMTALPGRISDFLEMTLEPEERSEVQQALKSLQRRLAEIQQRAL